MDGREILQLINQMQFSNNTEAWRFYSSLESAAKKLKEKHKKSALTEVQSIGEYAKTNYGGVQVIDMETKKQKESLKFFLKDRGLLDLCRNDDVDLNKVQTLIDAGKLTEEEVYEHIEIKPSSYLKTK
ncbi:hypothetical protein CPT_Stills87 [Bacillus phage Stills]|uniref:Uncharacterized protein n=1 Tax=Bacillus phage Stills TaxID=1610833 RepID=A0A0E3T7Q5_9CAUD|nr:hypothetical protein CPT_Stills87 [Bacillus phage Stills]AKC02715.1 hypothetical protein CPT_Stills87 [Bacillus phage Stills]